MITWIAFISLVASGSSMIWAATPRTANNCDYSKSKQILTKNKNGYTAEWTINDSPALSDPLITNDAKYALLKQWESQHTNLDWKGFLELHVSAVQKGIDQMPPDDPGAKDLKGDIAEVQMILGGQVGVVHSIACLESIPYLEFLNVVDLRKYPQEFFAWIFKKQGQAKVIGDFYFDPTAGEDPSGVSESATTLKERQKLVADGWELYAHIHDHTFVFQKDVEDLGAEVAPSWPDIQLYLELKPTKAIITNGLDTIEMSQIEVQKLQDVRSVPVSFSVKVYKACLIFRQWRVNEGVHKGHGHC